MTPQIISCNKQNGRDFCRFLESVHHFIRRGGIPAGWEADKRFKLAVLGRPSLPAPLSARRLLGRPSRLSESICCATPRRQLSLSALRVDLWRFPPGRAYATGNCEPAWTRYISAGPGRDGWAGRAGRPDRQRAVPPKDAGQCGHPLSRAARPTVSRAARLVSKDSEKAAPSKRRRASL